MELPPRHPDAMWNLERVAEVLKTVMIPVCGCFLYSRSEECVTAKRTVSQPSSAERRLKGVHRMA